MEKNKDLYISGNTIYLRKLCLQDANKDYCNWLNDPRVNRFLESRYQRWTVTKIKEYVKDINSSRSNLFLAIIRKDHGRHIGNIKLGPVNLRHKHCVIGIIIGDKSSWGKGFATEAIKLAKDYAFKTLKLQKLNAGVYSQNIGSLKAFQKAGFSVEGVQKKQYYCEGRYVDSILLGCSSTVKKRGRP